MTRMQKIIVMGLNHIVGFEYCSEYVVNSTDFLDEDENENANKSGV